MLRWSWTCWGSPSRLDGARSPCRVLQAHPRVGGDLKLVIAEPRILKVFEITDLVRVFPIFSTVDEAVGG